MTTTLVYTYEYTTLHCGPQNNEVQQLTLFSVRPHHFFSKYPSSKQETAKLELRNLSGIQNSYKMTKYMWTDQHHPEFN